MPENVINLDDKGGPNNINIARNKTFNPEFRHLINRVMGKESDKDGGAIDADGINKLNEEELLARLYRLHYDTRFIIDNQEINTSFRPYDINRELFKAGISEALAEHVRAQLEKSSLPAFAILSYSVIKKGFVPEVNNLARYSAADIIISLKSELFRKIFASPDGIIIDGASIQKNFFLNKIFHTADGQGCRLYFVMLGFVFDELAGELILPGKKLAPSFLPTALCMIEIDESYGRNDPGYFKNILGKRLSVPFLMINDNLTRNVAFKSFKGLSYPFYLLDYFFTVFLIRKESVGMRIKLSGRSDEGTAFLMKYTISKLSHVLSSDSAVIHILKDRLLVLTTSDYIEPINEIIDTYNRLFNEKLNLLVFYTIDFDDSIRIIQEIILNS